MIFRDILVPIDFSEASFAALAYAQTLAKGHGTPHLHIFHVTSDPHVHPWSIGASLDPAALLDTWKVDADGRLRALPIDTQATEVVIRVGDPSLEIVRYATSQDVDLVVMGTHGRGAVARMLLGSVAEKVVRSAPCPVVTVPFLQGPQTTR